MNGISQFKYFVYKGSFRIEDAIAASAKAAFLATATKLNYKGGLPLFSNTIAPGSYDITHVDYTFLNKKLRNTPGGALYYWSETLKLMHPTI
jgi:hypothetical protein